jgi:hypothetical protein
MGLRFQLCESLASKENGVICFLSLSKMLIQEKKIPQRSFCNGLPRNFGPINIYIYVCPLENLWQLVTGICDEGDALTLCEWHHGVMATLMLCHGNFSFAGTDRMMTFKNVVNLLRSLKDMPLLPCLLLLLDWFILTYPWFLWTQEPVLPGCFLHARAGGLMPMTDQLRSQ